MALKPLQATMPLGQFDGFDSTTLSLLGGEVVYLASVVNTNATDKAAYDVFDGYNFPNLRPVVKLATTNGAAIRPLMLADEGIAGYGTIFGTVVGGTVGQVSTGGAVLGPHSATGSGKVTCWAQPGLYAVSTDAVDTAAGGILPTAALPPGTGLSYTATGKLTPTGGGNKVSGAPDVATFVEFATNGSLVTTPNALVGAFNPPDGALVATTRSFTWAVIYFNPNP
jgi:hypothetical protein